MSISQIQSCWKEVTARVHISLSPQEIASDARAAATRLVIDSLLMRYSHELRGIVLAQRGGLKFATPAVFVGASPYVHVVATATLLVFAPPRGSELVGVVTYVGPDHVGLSVLQAFYAILPMSPVREFYQYDSRFEGGEWVKKWALVKRASGFQYEITVGRQVRFVVDGVKSSRSGLFQILASLNEESRNRNTTEPLGVLDVSEEVLVEAKEEDILLSAGEDDHVVENEGMLDVMLATKRSSAPQAIGGLPSLAGMGDNPFGDALMPTVGGLSQSSQKKKKKRSSLALPNNANNGKDVAKSSMKRTKSVKFEDVDKNAKDEPELAGTDEAPSVLTQDPVLTQAESGSASKEIETKARKKDRAEKKKKKKKKKKDHDRGSGEKPVKKKKEKRRRHSTGSTSAAELLYGGSMPPRIEDEKKEDVLVEEEKSHGFEGGNVTLSSMFVPGDGVGTLSQKRKQDEKNHQAGSRSATTPSLQVKKRKPRDSPVSEKTVKEEDEISSQTPARTIIQRTNDVNSTDANHASERKKLKGQKRKRENELVPVSSDEGQKHRKKKKKAKHANS